MRTTRGGVIGAIVKREIAGYFSTPTGYVFISLFVFLSAVAAFWQERFFATNLANLDQLNAVIPYLLVFFIPAVSMSLWAEEKKQGTEELLLTLPASDAEIVLGKYLAGLGIYSVALVFSLSHVVVLAWLGRPDVGLLAATYAGYWGMGAALLALAMLASLLTDNLTVAFILGGLFCAVPAFLDRAGAILSGGPARLAERLSLAEQFRDLAAGMVTPSALVYVAGLAGAALYANVALVGRRRWPSKSAERHYLLRALSLAVAVAAVTVLASHARLRWDATSEQIHSLAPDTRKLLQSLNPRQQVFIYAYFSPEVPRSYVEARNGLSAMLREFGAAGREAVNVRIVETVKYSPAAREAQERYSIRPYRVPLAEESARVMNEIYLGLAFTCGSEEFVIPFFDRGLPVEYELMRSIRVVSGARRRKVGILDTPARLFGGMDYQTRRQTQDWSIVAELRKQYEVAQVSPDAGYPEDLSVLVAAQPASLTQPQADRLTAWVRQGKPVLLLLDPMPAFNLELASQADLRPLLDFLGVNWPAERVVWDNYNPHPQLKSLPKEVVFAGRGFNPREAVSGGLQEVVLLYPGAIAPRSDAQTKFTPLIETTADSGALRLDELVQRSLFGVALNPNPPHKPDGQKRVLAARVTGAANAIVVADLDLMGEQFFELRRRGLENLNFDNVTFLLNAVDQLAGDDSFIALRKRRPRHRTLEAVEARSREYEARRLNDMQMAEALAEERLKEAQARLDRAVREIDRRPDLDEQARQVMIANVQSVENRRLTVARGAIEDEKQRQIESARADMENSIRGIQNTIKLMAVALPPAPALLLFLFVSLRRLARERAGTPVDRLVEDRTR
ncbi:MAG: Gldg family protein [Acidobacteria bacterium]|nr:Gldg family protein [Acidobacteriota bacterium]